MRKLIFLIFFLIPGLCFSTPIETLKGHATLEWKMKGQKFRFDQAVVLKADGDATFETIDDFGNTVMKMGFWDNQLILYNGDSIDVMQKKSFKKLLRIPLSKEEFVSALKYRLPPQSQLYKFKLDQKRGVLLSYEKKAKKKKERFKVIYDRITEKNGRFYPDVIKIIAHKTQLTLTWQSLTLQ